MTRLEELNREIRAQWAKYDAAVAAGMTGAPLAQIDKKLGRLERERDTLEIEASVLEAQASKRENVEAAFDGDPVKQLDATEIAYVFSQDTNEASETARSYEDDETTGLKGYPDGNGEKW